MKILYLDCGMGASGDMLTAALLELLPNKEQTLCELNALGIPNVTFVIEDSAKCGIKGTHVKVTVCDKEESERIYEHLHTHEHSHSSDCEKHTHEHSHGSDCEKHTHEHSHDSDCDEHSHGHSHHHTGMHEIKHIIDALPVSEKVKTDILSVYYLIAEAESHAHGVPVTDIHFHEVGTMDAVADIAAVCLLMEKLAPREVIVSPVHVGAGHVRCAHGILPVPAPATAYILRNTPIYGGEIKSELCTPTGAALLKHFASRFGDMPIMKPSAVGYGMGKKDFTYANCVRALIGESEDLSDTVTELCVNLDDMTAEAIAFAKEQFFEHGALDVYTVPIQMKKSRPGILLCVMCREQDKEKMINLIFKHTTTLGIRENICRRYTLSRSVETVSTDLGDTRKKTATGYGVKKEKYEYEDVANIAKNHNMSIFEVTDYLNHNKQ